MSQPDFPELDLDTSGDGGGEDPASVHITIFHTDDTSYASRADAGSESAADMAECITRCIRGIAAMWGTDLQVELTRRGLL